MSRPPSRKPRATAGARLRGGGRPPSLLLAALLALVAVGPAPAGAASEGEADPNRPGAEMQVPDRPPAPGGVDYDERPPFDPRTADGPEVPEWFPLLGSFELRCTTGNPNPEGVVDESCHQWSESAGELVPYHPWPAIDLSASEGTPVRAAGAGTVVSVGHNTSVPEPDALQPRASDEALAARAGGWIVVAHADGPNSVYKHVGDWFVVPGDHVEPGQVLGVVAYPGTATSHLHYDEQDPAARFNAPDARVPFDVMLARGPDGEVIRYPEALGTADWTEVPQRTIVTSRGWAHRAVVSSEVELRSVLAALSDTTEDGPFTIALAADIPLTGGQLEYTGDELVMIDGDPEQDGSRRRLTATAGSRVLEASSPDAALELRGVDLVGGGPVAGDGGIVRAAGPVTLADADATAGGASGSGGAISSTEWVALVRSEVFGNQATLDGGAVHAARVSVVDSAVHGNDAGGVGGGLATTVSPLTGTHIGGDYAQTDSNRVSNSTISSNQAGAAGGGVSTVGDLYTQNVTLHQNTAPHGEAAAVGGRLTTAASIFSVPPGRSACAVGSTRSFGGNLDSGDQCQLDDPLDQVNRPARLGALRLHGGVTPTHFPLQGSSVVDAFTELPDDVTGVFNHAPPCSPTGRSADQRALATAPPGFSSPWWALRPDPSHGGANGACDVGAVEAIYPPHALIDVGAWIEPTARWVTSTDRDVPPVMTGYPDGTFRPELNLSRGQAANALYGLAGRPSVVDVPRHQLSDVPPWLDDAVTWLVQPRGGEGGVMTGFADGTFRDADVISRGQFARALHRLAGSLDATAPLRFTDVGPWLHDAVVWISEDLDGARPIAGIMDGFADGTFAPDLPLKRSQFARAAHRLALAPSRWNDGSGSGVDPDGPIAAGFLPGLLWAPL